jgi:RNA polymerase sigma-70 factor (ECF subfamily)
VPEQDEQASLRALGDDRVRDTGERFVEAFERGDVDAILEVLNEDSTYRPRSKRGESTEVEPIADSWLIPLGGEPRLRYLRARIDGRLAFGAYLRRPRTDSFVPVALDVLELAPDGGVASLFASRDPRDFARLGLPVRLPADRPAYASRFSQ